MNLLSRWRARRKMRWAVRLGRRGRTVLQLARFERDCLSEQARARELLRTTIGHTNDAPWVNYDEEFHARPP